MIPLMWISITAWAIVFVILLIRITKAKMLDAARLRSDLLALLAYSIIMAIAIQTAVNALWFAIFEEPYPSETLQSLRFATLLGGLVLLAIAFVGLWEILRRTKTTTETAFTEPRVPVPSPKIETKVTPSETAVAQHRRRIDGIPGGHEVMTQLTYFKTIWEQHGGSDMATRWRPQYTSDMYMLCRSLHDLLAGYGTSWSFDMAHPVELISSEIKGLASSLQEGSNDEAIVHGDTAYRLTRELVSFLESQKT